MLNCTAMIKKKVTVDIFYPVVEVANQIKGPDPEQLPYPDIGDEEKIEFKLNKGISDGNAVVAAYGEDII